MEKKDHLVRRYFLFIIGLFIASMGVALSTKAGLGVSPVSAVPYSMSLVLPVLSLGGWLNVLSVIQITTQVLILRKNCNPLEIAIQTVLAFVYGYMTNFSCWILQKVTAETYPVQFLLMILSCFTLGFGIWVQFKGGVAMLPGEAMNRAIAQAIHKQYANVKIFFDVLYIVLAAIICFVILGHLEGVREGSVIAAVFIGNIIKIYNWIFNKITASGKGES